MTNNSKTNDRQQISASRPRDSALSAGLLTRVFHQPALIYFNAVARYSSIREAARQLNVASSAVTRQIGQLEDALGIALFQRDRKRLKLSPAGEVLYRHVQRLTAPMEAAVSEIEMLRGVKTGTVRIGAVESVGLSFLPQLITAFGEHYPRLHLDVTIASSSGVIDLLTEEQIDIGFAFIARPSRQIDVTMRRDVSIGVLMHPDHPLATEKHLTIGACMQYPLCVAKPEISIREVIDPFLYASREILPAMVEVDSIRMLVALALGKRYVSITTPIGAQNELQSGELVFRPLQDKGLPTNQFGIVVRSVSSLHFAPAVFYEHARTHFDTLDFPGAV